MSALLAQTVARVGAGNVRSYLGGALHEDFRFDPMMTGSKAGCKRDCRVPLHASTHPRISDRAEATLRGSPA
jgi:hypothetical protein